MHANVHKYMRTQMASPTKPTKISLATLRTYGQLTHAYRFVSRGPLLNYNDLL